MSKSPKEREFKYLVSGNDPAAVCDEIASLDRLGEFGLGHRRSVAIRDVYWDTPDKKLYEVHWSLRIRQRDDETFVTLKSGGREIEGGGVERTEIELPWSADALSRIQTELKESGVSIAGSSLEFNGNPHRVLETLGLNVIQDRNTARRTSEVYLKENSDTALAELAVDRVSFNAMGSRFLHFEVEIETLDASQEPSIREFVDTLIDRFGSDLRPWRYSKLATGLAIDRLVIRKLRGDGPGLSGPGQLVRADYEIIKRVLGG